MTKFINLHEITQQFQSDPATLNDPVKRIFICDGEAITANIATDSGDDSMPHTQPDHDEVVLSSNLDATGSAAVMAVKVLAAAHQSGAESRRTGFWGWRPPPSRT